MKLLTKDQINNAISSLLNDEIVVLPTDTIYGLSAIVNDDNQSKINELKKADNSKPLIVLIDNIDRLKNDFILSEEVVEILNSVEPTTVLLKRNNSDELVGVRIVKRDDLKNIINIVGPIFSTSVNYHTQEPINDLKSLNEFIGSKKVYFTEELKSKPSRIYNSVKKEFIR